MKTNEALYKIYDGSERLWTRAELKKKFQTSVMSSGDLCLWEKSMIKKPSTACEIAFLVK